jgi:hypothetical protein
MLMHRDRLWNGGFASSRAVAIAFVAGPVAVTLAVWLSAIVLGSQVDYDGPAVVRFLSVEALRTTVTLSFFAALPLYLFLAKCGKAGLIPFLIVGAAPGLYLGLVVGTGPAASASPLVAAPIAAGGLLYAAVVWFVMRLVDGNLRLPSR